VIAMLCRVSTATTSRPRIAYGDFEGDALAATRTKEQTSRRIQPFVLLVMEQRSAAPPPGRPGRFALRAAADRQAEEARAHCNR